MGRCTSLLRGSERNECELLDMWVENNRVPNGRRTLHCASCGISIDRNVNAARNILAKGRGGVRFTPDGPPEVRKEAVKGNETTTPILRADGGKVTQG